MAAEPTTRLAWSVWRGRVAATADDGRWQRAGDRREAVAVPSRRRAERAGASKWWAPAPARFLAANGTVEPPVMGRERRFERHRSPPSTSKRRPRSPDTTRKRVDSGQFLC